MVFSESAGNLIGTVIMIRFLPIMFIFLATAVPTFIIFQSPRNAGRPLPQPTLSSFPSVSPSPPPSSPYRSVTLLLRYQPFKNKVELVSTSFAKDPAPSPAPLAARREGKFVLKIEHMTATGSADYITWASVDAVDFLADAQYNPTHELSITVPYEPASTVLVREPTSLREYARFLIP